MITAEKMDVDSNINTIGKDQKGESSMLTAKQVTASENFIFNEALNKSKISIVELNKFEKEVYQLAQYYSKNDEVEKLDKLIKGSRVLITQLSKAKAGKLVKNLVGSYLEMKSVIKSPAAAIALCLDSIEWCRNEKRTFLRQAIECKLVRLYIDIENFEQALEMIEKLTKELKKLDDKAMLVEIQLLESKAQHKLSNIPKARSALTSARTAANAIYCPPQLQGALDFQSGILHVEEKDFKTGYSYFYETFECYDTIDKELAITCLQYMLLCKVMLDLPNDVNSTMNGKLSLKYSGRKIDFMIEISKAQKNRSLSEFEQIMSEYKSELDSDAVIKSHLHELYETMLEQNLCRLIEPFSNVEISHIAKLIGMTEKLVEEKLSKMILDKKFTGILDQGAGCLIIFEPEKSAEVYNTTIECIDRMEHVVDSLYKKARRLK